MIVVGRVEDPWKGRIGAYRCSFDFKQRIIRQETRRLCGERGAWKRSTVEQWIGFSLDERHRMKEDRECRCTHTATTHRGGPCQNDRCACPAFARWRINRWPLIELRWRRSDTIRWFAENGHPTPARSACFFCPNSGNARWRDLQRDHPDLFERSCAIDEHIREGDAAFNRRGQEAFRGTMFLHGSLIPLRDADLRTVAERVADDGQDTLFDEDALAADCEAGVCFT